MTGSRAKDTTDALAKTLYSKMFDLIVVSINKSIQGNGSVPCLPSFVGLLDIYGFEVFEFNSFEQVSVILCTPCWQRDTHLVLTD